MTFNDTMAWQRTQSHHINRLAGLGDALAVKLIQAYRDLYDDKFNPAKQANWMAICDDYCRRDLTQTTKRILQDRFGHKIPFTLPNIKVT